MNEERNKRIITILSIFTIIFTVMGGSLAYWNWSSEVRTGVAFTIDKDFTCSADGGGHITPSTISLEPSTCDNPNTSIKRKIVVTPDIKKSGLEISLDMWLNVNSLGTGLSNSVNLKYVLTTSESSCEEGTIISKGNFNSKTTGDRVMLLEKNYTADASETYYLYIWLDKEETSMDTMNQSFDFSLGGNCSNYVGEPEAPVLDPAMIPVTIANDGKVTTVSKDDPNWYNYSNKEWANIVLVNEEATAGVTDSHPRSYYQNNIGEEVTEEDILAYYVWIPRYKYKITKPGVIIPATKCGELEKPNEEDNPNCYGLKYIVSASDRIKIAEFFLNEQCEYYGIENSGDSSYPCPYTAESEHMLAIADNLIDGGTYHGIIYFGEETLPSLVNVHGLNITYEETTGFKENIIARPYYKNPVIEVMFESKDEDMILGNTTTQYRSHSAFWWDNNNDDKVNEGETIAGLWIGKFETTVPEPYVEIETTTILPNSYPKINQEIAEMFDDSKKFCENGNIYGLSNLKNNSHVAKNRDWEAVAYLSQSIYGKNKNITANTTVDGLSGTTLTGNGRAENDELYGKNHPQSTTGNISGVFDMAGGIQERVMGNYGNQIGESFLSQMPEKKYYDLYFHKEDYENKDYAIWIVRGGSGFTPDYDQDGNEIYSNIFDVSLNDGTLDNTYTWRSVLINGFANQ